jgi:DNA modification methylase
MTFDENSLLPPIYLLDEDELDEDDFWVGPPLQQTHTGLLRGDCLVLLKTLDANSIDSVVTDPPYELGFMGKGWDSSGIAYNVNVWKECLRVLKPGGHLLAFGGSRTYHRLASAVEDAGFEIRDQIMWLYGSGFPKSLDVAKAIDKVAGVEFSSKPASGVGFMNPEGAGGYNNTNNQLTREGESTTDALKWSGWGTALKPAHEPIVVARKPLIGTVVKNVLEYGTGAINIDASRVSTGDEVVHTPQSDPAKREGVVGTDLGITDASVDKFQNAQRESIERTNTLGRWPANVIHDGSDEVLAGFPNTKGKIGMTQHGSGTNKVYGKFERSEQSLVKDGTPDEGSAARFFYCAKASKSERNAGLEQLPEVRESDRVIDDGVGGANPRNRTNTAKQNHHPTVKPLALMRYLVKLVTPPGGTVLDPFLGSGTTAVAAILEGFNWVGCEITEDYWPIIEARVAQAFAKPATICK